MADEGLGIIVNYIEKWRANRASEKWRARGASNGFPHLLFVVQSYELMEYFAELVISSQVGIIRIIDGQSIKDVRDVLHIAQTTKRNSIIFISDIFEIDGRGFDLLSRFIRDDDLSFFCSICKDQLNDWNYASLFDAAVLYRPDGTCTIVELNRDRVFADLFYTSVEHWFSGQQERTLGEQAQLANPAAELQSSYEAARLTRAKGTPSRSAASPPSAIQEKAGSSSQLMGGDTGTIVVSKEGTFGQFECEDCFRILSKSHAHKYSLNERVGWISGTTRTSYSSSNRSSNWSSFTSSGRLRSGGGSSTTSRHGASRTSGRTYYKIRTILICSDCLRKREEQHIQQLKIFAGVVIAIVVGFIMLISLRHQ